MSSASQDSEKQSNNDKSVEQVQEEVKHLVVAEVRIEHEVHPNESIKHTNRSKSFDQHQVIEICADKNSDNQNRATTTKLNWDNENDPEAVRQNNEGANIKLLKPNPLAPQKSWGNPDGNALNLKKVESVHIEIKTKEFEEKSGNSRNKEKSNGKNMHEKMNSEDLGVLMPLFDCIFWVSNQKVVIQKLLSDSLNKRVNEQTNEEYDLDNHYYISYLMGYQLLNKLKIDEPEVDSVENKTEDIPEEKPKPSTMNSFISIISERRTSEYLAPIDIMSTLKKFHSHKGMVSITHKS